MRDDVEKVLIPHFRAGDVKNLTDKDVEEFIRAQRAAASFKGQPLAPKTIRVDASPNPYPNASPQRFLAPYDGAMMRC